MWQRKRGTKKENRKEKNKLELLPGCMTPHTRIGPTDFTGVQASKCKYGWTTRKRNAVMRRHKKLS